MTDKPNKLVQATNILEMVLLGASDLIDYLENNNKDENLLKWKRKERQQLLDGTYPNHGNVGFPLGITISIIS